MKVPKMVRRKVMMMRSMFQIFSIPFRSWIMAEWMKAVPASQGMKAAFSTGSQAQ